MIGYTKNELMAMDAADKAFAEVRKVAEEFARQTGMRYHRNVTCWTSGSYFTPRLGDTDERWNEVHDLYDGWNNEAYECAWAIEDAWNGRVTALRERLDGHLAGYVMAETDNCADYYDRRIDEDYDEHEALRDEVGRIVEDWYDSAAECAWYECMEDVA